MNNNHIKIDLVNADASYLVGASAILIKNAENCSIELVINNTIKKVFQGNDFFVALCEMRKWLKDWKDFYPLCKGTLVNVFPSRMSRQMSKGLKAYYLVIGKQAKEENLVNIFDAVDSKQTNMLSTVTEQEEFYRKWINSL